MKRMKKVILFLFSMLFILCIQGCSSSDEVGVITSASVIPYAWEWNGESEYWIDPDIGVAERDKLSWIYYFVDSTHGIKCTLSYNFDYVGSQHSIDRKGYPFTYEIVDRDILMYFDDYRESLKFVSNGVSLITSDGIKIIRRNYNADDNNFLNAWLPVCWPELYGSGSGNNNGSGNNGSSDNNGSSNNSSFDFKLDASTVQVFLYESGYKKWVVWLSVGTNNLKKRQVNEFQIDVRALNGNIINKKEYGDINVYPDKYGVSLLITDLQNISDDKLHWWSTVLYVTTVGEDELKLEFKPSWINSAGTYEGEVVYKNYQPTHIIESE